MYESPVVDKALKNIKERGRTEVKRKIKILLSVLFALVLCLVPISYVGATNPQVTMTVTAGIISITNTQSTWALGYATLDEVIWFSADNTQDDDYSTVNNTGSLPVDVEIQGTNFEGGDYDWTLASSTGDQQFSLYANSSNGSATYDIEVKSSSYNDLITDLDLGTVEQYVWSMKFTAPSAFHASDDKAQKSATVTLVASEHV